MLPQLPLFKISGLCSLSVFLGAALTFQATAAFADFDYSCRCISNAGCLYDTEILKLKVSGPDMSVQVLRYSDVTLSYLIDSKYSPAKNVNFFQYTPNPEKTETLPDGPFNLWIEKQLVQGGYRLSTGAIGGFAMIPGNKISTFICSLQ
jgi:hypothetical protein